MLALRSGNIIPSFALTLALGVVAGMAAAILVTPLAYADNGDCSQPSTQGQSPTATDCLFILRAAVGSETCTPECICALKGTLPITATDALLCLTSVVGTPVTLACPCGGGTGYTAEAPTFISTVEIPVVDLSGDEPDIPCCKDFGEISRDFIEDGTNNIDNVLALLASLLDAIGERDMNASVNGQIENGNLVLLLDHQGVNPTATPDPFELVFLRGEYAQGTQYAAASIGNGEFLIDPSSFEPGTETPNVIFPTASYDDDTVTASGGVFETIIPFSGSLVEISINDAEIDGMHSGISDDGLAYEAATVSGYIAPADLITAINGVMASSSCDCLGITGPIFTEDGGVWSATGCLADAESLCTLPNERNCVVIGELFDLDDDDAVGLCDLIPDALFDLADLDLDSDTETFEGMSASINFTGAEGSISGIVPD